MSVVNCRWNNHAITGKWEGPIELGNVRVTGGFEVFDGKGGWDFLFGNHCSDSSKQCTTTELIW
jgi:hypothetical protein